MIDILEKILDMYRMSEIFSDSPELGKKKSYSNQKQEEVKIVKQIEKFLEELKNTGTIDFILESKEGTLVLSAQEQYLENDNISENLKY